MHALASPRNRRNIIITVPKNHTVMGPSCRGNWNGVSATTDTRSAASRARRPSRGRGESQKYQVRRPFDGSGARVSGVRKTTRRSRTIATVFNYLARYWVFQTFLLHSRRRGSPYTCILYTPSMSYRVLKTNNHDLENVAKSNQKKKWPDRICLSWNQLNKYGIKDIEMELVGLARVCTYLTVQSIQRSEVKDWAVRNNGGSYSR